MAFVVNPKGVTHTVGDDVAEGLLKQGFTAASDEQIAAWYAGQGLAAPGAEEEQPATPATSAKGKKSDGGSGNDGGADSTGAGANS